MVGDNRLSRIPCSELKGVLLKRGTENETEQKTEWNGKQKVSKENKYINFVDIQLLTRENDLK